MRLLSTFLVVGLLAGSSTLAAPVVLTPQDLGDFAVVVPLDRVWRVLSNYLAYDPQVKSLLGFLHKDEFKGFIAGVDKIPEFQEFINALEESGYEAHKHWNILHTAIGVPELDNPFALAPPSLTGGIEGLIKDIKSLVNAEDVKKVYDEKVKNNPSFRMLVDLFESMKFKKVLVKAAALPDVQALLSELGDLNIDSALL